MTLAILCPGQGRQHAGMLDLVADDDHAQAVLDDAARVLAADPRDWLHEPNALARNARAQPLICVAELATWRALAEHVPRPAAFAGYSVGELASHACADALDASDLCALAVARAGAMDEACRDTPGALIAVKGLGRKTVEALCRDRQASPAIVLDVASFVVGGTAQALDAFAADARMRGASVRPLPVDVPAHTPLLASAVPRFRAALAASRLVNPSVPVLSGIDASLVTRRDDAIRVLSRQLAETIDWARGLETLVERGCRIFLELGPGSALSRMLRDRFPEMHARSLDDFRSLEGAANWVRSRLA